MIYLGTGTQNDKATYVFAKGAVIIHIEQDSVDCLGTAACSAKAYFFGE